MAGSQVLQIHLGKGKTFNFNFLFRMIYVPDQKGFLPLASLSQMLQLQCPVGEAELGQRLLNALSADMLAPQVQVKWESSFPRVKHPQFSWTWGP